jgi:hypothetical protein
MKRRAFLSGTAAILRQGANDLRLSKLGATSMAMSIMSVRGHVSAQLRVAADLARRQDLHHLHVVT